MTGRCADCGYLMRRKVNNWELLQLTEADRYRLTETDHPIDAIHACFVEAEPFKSALVRERIDCPFYIRRVPGASPREHAEMQQVLDARREMQEMRAQDRATAQAAQNQQRRLQLWNLAIVGVVAAISGGALIVSIIALVGG